MTFKAPEIKLYCSPYFLFIFIYFCAAGIAGAQTPGNLVLPDTAILAPELKVVQVSVAGNDKTKGYIIEREFGLDESDTLKKESLASRLEDGRKRIYNLNLFNEVDVTAINLDSANMILSIVVVEKWYLYPLPQFQLVDRNYNEWIKVHNASLKRVNYGIKFSHYNFSGRRDPLKITLLTGYNRDITVTYSQPYSNRKLNEGFSVAGSYVMGREMNYKTSKNNKLLQFQQPGFVTRRLLIGGNYSKRRSAYRRDFVSVQYSHFNLHDSVVMPRYNPAYFNEDTHKKGFIDLSVGMRYVNTNNNNYPLVGSAYQLSLSKRGFGLTGGVNMFTVQGEYLKFVPVAKNLYASFEAMGLLKLPFDQPYLNQHAMGYLNFYMRGLEYYVVDGVAAGILRSTVKKKLISFDIPVPFRIRTVPKIPVTLFAKTYGDVGYAFNKDKYAAMLNNRILYTGGIGIDVLTLYDVSLKIEYSFNQLGEKGLFLHSKTSF